MRYFCRDTAVSSQFVVNQIPGVPKCQVNFKSEDSNAAEVEKIFIANNLKASSCHVKRQHGNSATETKPAT